MYTDTTNVAKDGLLVSKSLRTCGMPGANMDEASGTMKVINARTSMLARFFRGVLSKPASADSCFAYLWCSPRVLLRCIPVLGVGWVIGSIPIHNVWIPFFFL